MPANLASLLSQARTVPEGGWGCSGVRIRHVENPTHQGPHCKWVPTSTLTTPIYKPSFHVMFHSFPVVPTLNPKTS